MSVLIIDWSLKHHDKRRNSLWWTISPFATLFSNVVNKKIFLCFYNRLLLKTIWKKAKLFIHVKINFPFASHNVFNYSIITFSTIEIFQKSVWMFFKLLAADLLYIWERVNHNFKIYAKVEMLALELKSLTRLTWFSPWIWHP